MKKLIVIVFCLCSVLSRTQAQNKETVKKNNLWNLYADVGVFKKGINFGLGLKVFNKKFYNQFNYTYGSGVLNCSKYTELTSGIGKHFATNHAAFDGSANAGFLLNAVNTDMGGLGTCINYNTFNTVCFSIRFEAYVFGKYENMGVLSQVNLNNKMSYLSFGFLLGSGKLK